MKEFVTAVAEATTESTEEQKGMAFAVDGVELRCFKPRDGQVAVLMASTGRHSSEEEKVAGLINFFVAVLDNQSHTYIVNRLLDREDEFGLEQVTAIMEWMIEEWSGRPTQSPSVSTGSQRSDGLNSTPPTPVLTSSGSPSIVS